jgi:hypothetical protein
MTNFVLSGFAINVWLAFPFIGFYVWGVQWEEIHKQLFYCRYTNPRFILEGLNKGV